VALDHDIREFFGRAEQLFGRWGILEARQCRLRTQALPIDRVAVQEKLLDGIISQGAGVITVGVTGGDTKTRCRRRSMASCVTLPG